MQMAHETNGMGFSKKKKKGGGDLAELEKVIYQAVKKSRIRKEVGRERGGYRAKRKPLTHYISYRSREYTSTASNKYYI